MTVPYQNLDNGNYTLIIKSFTAASKGDQPLVISGEWEIAFTV